jgi:MoaA/NifB/PqqE/SkfB family radical SAM enzyme
VVVRGVAVDTEQMSKIIELHQLIPETPPANFCIAPFQSIRQNPYGRNSPCAFGAGEWHHGDLTPEQRWDSVELNQLRAEFINGDRPSACHRCWAEEDSGKKSLRQRQIEYFPNDYEDFIRSGKWQQGPKTAVFKSSNVCNLACRSCGGWDTNSYTPEGLYYLEKYKTEERSNGKIEQWNKFIPKLPPKHMDFSQYYSIAHNLEKIDFFGGDPFLNTTQLDLLEYLVQQGLSKNITLYYSTNCTNHPTERLKRAWNNFKRIEIAMSIDGLEQEFEYLRWPGKWDEMNLVADHILGLKGTMDCEIYTMGSLTVSVLNAGSIDRLTAWVEDKIGPYYINMVNSPAWLAVHIAPESVKTALIAQTNNTELLGYLTLQEHNPMLWKQFVIWTKRQDLYREQKFADAFPEYFKLIQPYWDPITDLSEDNFHSNR